MITPHDCPEARRRNARREPVPPSTTTTAGRATHPLVGVLHGTEESEAHGLARRVSGWPRQEAGREESIAEERRTRDACLPERGGISRRFGFRLSLFDQFDEMTRAPCSYRGLTAPHLEAALEPEPVPSQVPPS